MTQFLSLLTYFGWRLVSGARAEVELRTERMRIWWLRKASRGLTRTVPAAFLWLETHS
ncbi:rCG25299 [Rattus norvegicus]|uniref:RCG25299 n=1 Tax=Rattus norvegicus TaxID=10116 RepID=A6I3R5_RAT|nr:rCG25299 [Rattus norvegicus]